MRFARKVWHQEHSDPNIESFLLALENNGLFWTKTKLYEYESERRIRFESIDDIHKFCKTVDIAVWFFTREGMVKPSARYDSITKLVMMDKKHRIERRNTKNPLDTGFILKRFSDKKE